MCGGGNPVDDFSDFIGTGGGDQGLLNVVDEGVQSVGSGLAEVDDFVNEEIPGGYLLPAAIAVALATGYVDPTLFAAEAGAGAGTAGLTAAEAAALAESAALADSAMIGAGGLGAGASAGLTAAEIAALAESSALADSAMIGAEGVTAGEVGGGAITSAIPETPISQYELSPRYDFSPEVPIQSVPPEYDPTGSLYTEARAPIYDFSPTTPVQYVSPELDPTGSLAKAGGISTMDVLRGVNLAKGLLSSGQEQAAAPTTQFRGTRIPQGQVDYSGILSLLQMQSPQRRSLLG
jgi:hypothetical protein